MRAGLDLMRAVTWIWALPPRQVKVSASKLKATTKTVGSFDDPRHCPPAFPRPVDIDVAILV